jgi:hypothetical protein
MAGAALVFGPLPQLLPSPRGWDAALMGLGAGILLLSRPFEGLVVCLPVAAAVLVQAVRSRWSWNDLLVRTVAPGLLALLPAVAVTLAVNQAVTGSAWSLPYAEYGRQYERLPFFLFGDVAESKSYRHQALENFFSKVLLAERTQLQDWGRFAVIRGIDVVRAAIVFPGLMALVCLFGTRYGQPRRVVSLSYWAAAATALELTASWFQPHYVAHVGPALVVLLAAGARGWRLHCRGMGRHIVLGLFLLYLGAAAVTLQAYGRAPRTGWPIDRATIVTRLEQAPGRHLIIVQYDHRRHTPHAEWVYNAADIDGSPVIWAREMDPESNRRLLEYFADRRVWLVRPDAKPVQVLELNPKTGQPLKPSAAPVRSAPP